MRRLLPSLTIALATAMAAASGAQAGGSEPPDPNLYDTIYGIVDNVRYSSDAQPYMGTAGGSAHSTAGCGSAEFRLVGAGAAAGGNAAHAWQAFNRGFDYTDADIELDDGVLGVGYGPRGKAYRSFAICIGGAQLDYRSAQAPNQPTAERAVSVNCVGAGWHVVSGTGAISTGASWLSSSYPIDSGDQGSTRDDGWRSTASDTVNGLGAYKVYAVCAKNLGRRYVSSSPSSIAVGHATKRSVSCGSDHVIGGGALVSGQSDKSRLVVSAPYDGSDADQIPDDGWRTKVYNLAGSSKQVTSFAVCLDA